MLKLIFIILHAYNDLFIQALKNNGSLYAHVFFARSGYPPDPKDPEYQQNAAFGRTYRKILWDYNFIVLYKSKIVFKLDSYFCYLSCCDLFAQV